MPINTLVQPRSSAATVRWRPTRNRHRKLGSKRPRPPVGSPDSASADRRTHHAKDPPEQPVHASPPPRRSGGTGRPLLLPAQRSSATQQAPKLGVLLIDGTSCGDMLAPVEKQERRAGRSTPGRRLRFVRSGRLALPL